jgi:hypothetical protein
MVQTTSFRELIPILQLSIGPVILISGVGLLLLTLTNRFGRLLDRSRALHQNGGREPAHLRQIEILQRRAGILRLSITFASVTILLVALLILLLFVAAVLQWEAGWLLIALFCASQLALVGAMVTFIHDMNLSLLAIRLELDS